MQLIQGLKISEVTETRSRNSLSHGQPNLIIQESKPKLLQSQEIFLATALKPSFMARITRKRT